MLFKSQGYHDIFLTKILSDDIQEEGSCPSSESDFEIALFLFVFIYSEIHYRRFYFQQERSASCSMIFTCSSHHALSRFIMRNLFNSTVSILSLDFFSHCHTSENISPVKTNILKSKFVELVSDLDVPVGTSTPEYLSFIYLHLFSMQLDKLSSVSQHLDLFKTCNLLSSIASSTTAFPFLYKLDVIDALIFVLPQSGSELFIYLYERSVLENVSTSKLFKSLMNMISNKQILLDALSVDGFRGWVIDLLFKIPTCRAANDSENDQASSEHMVFYIGFLSNFFENLNMLILDKRHGTEENMLMLKHLFSAIDMNQHMPIWCSKLAYALQQGSAISATSREVLIFPFLANLCGHILLHLQLCNLYDTTHHLDLKILVLSSLNMIINSHGCHVDDIVCVGETNFLASESKALFELLSLHVGGLATVG